MLECTQQVQKCCKRMVWMCQKYQSKEYTFTPVWLSNALWVMSTNTAGVWSWYLMLLKKLFVHLVSFVLFSAKFSKGSTLYLHVLLGGGVRVCSDAALLNFLCGFAEIFILSCSIVVLQNKAVCGI